MLYQHYLDELTRSRCVNLTKVFRRQADEFLKCLLIILSYLNSFGKNAVIVTVWRVK